jgi:hypothetical protein
MARRWHRLWPVTTMVAVALACGGRSSPSGPAPLCPRTIVSGTSCSSEGLACAFLGCSGCICGADKTWTCPVATAAPDKCCTGAVRGTPGLPCDTGDGNACGGVCWPDALQGTALLDCVPATPSILQRLELGVLDGIDCAPDGAPGSDCTHACSGGACVAVDANPGSSCVPPGDGSPPANNVPTTCDGSCDGAGTCVRDSQPSTPPLLQGCSYVSCTPDGFSGGQFTAPEGIGCSTGDPCKTGGVCDGSGVCAGTTHVPGCRPESPED